MALKYIGDGSWFAGVPARDLTDEEEAEYGARFKEREGVALEDTALYTRDGGKRAAKPASEEE